MVEPSTILQAQTARADGTVFSGQNSQNGTGVAVKTGTPRKESGFEPRLAAKDFGKEAASLAFSYCPEVVMPDATSVVVLQDRTVGTVMVPKQT